MGKAFREYDPSKPFDVFCIGVIVAANFIAAVLSFFIGQWLLWWVWRLSFLGRTDEELALYHIDDPGRQRLHARLAGFCFCVGVGLAIMPFWHHEPVAVVAAPLLLVFYVFLTIIFFRNRREDPVANCWD